MIKLNLLPPCNVFATMFIFGAMVFQPNRAQAQTDMTNMPGMAHKTAAPAPADAPMPEAEMEAMPGMNSNKPAATKSAGSTPAENDMAGMPGMSAPGASKRQQMDDMRGMPNRSEDTSERASAPGIYILRPPQKWVPHRGNSRAAELLSRPALEEFMKPLPPPIEDSMLHSLALFDLLEYRVNSTGSDTLNWDFVGWFGGDTHRLWVKSEGSLDLSAGNRGVGDLQLLYGRMIAPFWDLQLGVRAKQNFGSGLNGNTRTYAVIGLQGLAPGNFDVDPAIYISDRGEVSAELTVSADLYLTQRLILQPRFQGEVSLQGDDRFGTSSGVNETDIGLRLRYEIAREFAPYIGVSWSHSYGSTANIAREEGEPTDAVAFVAGLRLWW